MREDEICMEMIFKYPRTRHIEGSKLQTGDEDLKNIRFENIKGQYLVIEEKVDGANCGISFDENGKMYLQSRGHYLDGGYGERQFDLFKTWANCYYLPFYQVLGNRYVMYGEWLYAKHTVFYDLLPHYFMEFDVFDKEKRIFLSTNKRRELLKGLDFLHSVLVLYEGYCDTHQHLTSFMGNSNFKSCQWQKALEVQCMEQGQTYELVKKQTDTSDRMEGLYIKVETEETVGERMKYVRGTFINTIMDSETHWLNRPLLPNCLKPGADLFGNGWEGEVCQR